MGGVHSSLTKTPQCPEGYYCVTRSSIVASRLKGFGYRKLKAHVGKNNKVYWLRSDVAALVGKCEANVFPNNDGYSPRAVLDYPCLTSSRLLKTRQVSAVLKIHNKELSVLFEKAIQHRNPISWYVENKIPFRVLFQLPIHKQKVERSQLQTQRRMRINPKKCLPRKCKQLPKGFYTEDKDI
ncbi:hypothetical protein JTE90_022620 [Oedothorax gibbosus]|uniref:Uncharacterized protein n=1 Tax=Oedothorax gibbosus TaxID=931172 RepID=A0AAV6TT19_9ARAC|nr:hypothetical protein JTE90_022620 [Oedothorax gibbosus]